MMEERDLSIEDLEDLDEIVSAPEPEKKKPTRRKPSSSKQSLERRLAKLIELIGTVTSGLDSYDGAVIVDNAPKLASALVDLANESPRARRILEGLLEGGAWAGVGTVFVWEIATPIALHHRMLPEPINTNLAEIRGVPVKEPKKRPDRLRAVEVDLSSLDSDNPVRYVEARNPETGEWGTFPAGPDGRPIFPNREEAEPES